MGLQRSGATFPMLLSVGEIKQAGLEGYVGIIRDLSDVRRAQEQVRSLEEQLLHADRLVILGELTAAFAHEINQPLTAIAAYADAAARSSTGRRRIRGRRPRTCTRSASASGPGAARSRGRATPARPGAQRSISKARHDINDIIKNILLLFEFEVKKARTDLCFSARAAGIAVRR